MNLHTNVYTAAVDHEGNADCESGQRGYLEKLTHYNTDPNIKIVTDPHIPGNSGTTLTGRPRVPEGQTFTRLPESGPRLPAGAGQVRRPASKRSNAMFGLIAAIVIAVVVVMGFRKDNPFNNPYSIKAAFKNVNDLKPRSPVRIAGVNVGKVQKIEPMRGRERRGRHAGDQGRGPADPRGRDGEGAAADLPRGQLLRRPQAGLAERADDGQGRHDPGAEHRRAGAVRPVPRDAAERHARGPADRAAGVRQGGRRAGRPRLQPLDPVLGARVQELGDRQRRRRSASSSTTSRTTCAARGASPRASIATPTTSSR